MFNRIRRGVEIIGLCFLLSSCASAQTRGPSAVDNALLGIDSAMSASALSASLSCGNTEDPATCTKTVHEAHAGAMEAMKVIREWAPELKDALLNADEVGERTARDHMTAALEHIPAAYDDVRELVLKLME